MNEKWELKMKKWELFAFLNNTFSLLMVVGERCGACISIWLILSIKNNFA
jgi:hypothetical protein